MIQIYRHKVDINRIIEVMPGSKGSEPILDSVSNTDEWERIDNIEHTPKVSIDPDASNRPRYNTGLTVDQLNDKIMKNFKKFRMIRNKKRIGAKKLAQELNKKEE